ncbi:MAG: hypothetical protein DYG98_08560 [Haliscomenobacteraceae bacterium CHB4]|nr:hypothetical protein [Haliscomenobacteraceae bacterium CHB4]
MAAVRLRAVRVGFAGWPPESPRRRSRTRPLGGWGETILPLGACRAVAGGAGRNRPQAARVGFASSVGGGIAGGAGWPRRGGLRW